MKTNCILDFSYKYSANKIMHPTQHIFDFYSVKDNAKLGTLVCHKSELQIRPNYDGKVLAIDFLEVTNRNQGLGTKILKFAEEYSKQIGCKGYMTVKADGTFMPERIPHIFYRKYGFSTLEKKTDKKLDKFIRQKTNATKKDFPCLLMHYPNVPKNPTRKILSFVKQLLKNI